MKKLIAMLLAASIVMALGVTVFADDVTVAIGIADTNFAHSDWDTSVTVSADGQYTIESTVAAGCTDLSVFVLDFKEMSTNFPNASAVLDKIEIDGTELAFDASKILYGDLEDNGNYRIEIYNVYGAGTASDSPIENNTPVASSVKLTFTVSGLSTETETATETESTAPEAESEAAPEETETAPNTTALAAEAETTAPSPSTGIAIAVIPAVVSMAAAVVSKKH